MGVHARPLVRLDSGTGSRNKEREDMLNNDQEFGMEKHTSAYGTGPTSDQGAGAAMN
jgi:hypothetical protein